jgi:hypothetical protein
MPEVGVRACQPSKRCVACRCKDETYVRPLTRCAVILATASGVCLRGTDRLYGHERMLDKAHLGQDDHRNRLFDPCCFAVRAENACTVYHYLLHLQRFAVADFPGSGRPAVFANLSTGINS